MSIIQPFFTYDNIIDITNYVNMYRERNQAPPLQWDNSITSYSQNWSFYMTSNNLLQHSGTTYYGENISFFEGYGTDQIKLIKLAIDNWYNEIALYDFNNPGYSEATGHFTCLVWLSSTTFGIGISINMNTGAAYICFNTYPPGNITNEFEQNVLPLIYNPIIPPEPEPCAEPFIEPAAIETAVIEPAAIEPAVIEPAAIETAVNGIFQPLTTSNKQLVINQLLSIISQMQQVYNPVNIIQIINIIINEIQNSSPF